MWPGWQKRLWAPALLFAIGGIWWIIVTLFDRCSNNLLNQSPAGCFEFWFNRYQTLVGAAVAIAAAWVAVRPVWKQLNLASVQTAVALHGALSSRIGLLATRADRTCGRLDKFAAELQRGHYHTSGTGAFSHWAWDMESVVDDELATLIAEEAENIEADEGTIARTILIKSLRKLESCFSDVNSTIHLDRIDDLAADPRLQEEAKTAEIAAEQNLPSHINATVKAIRDLRAAFDRDLEELRSKRQLLDNTLIASEIY